MPNDIHIKDLIDKLDLSVYAFETSIGVGMGTIQKAIREKRQLTNKTIRKIILKYPNVSESWLLTGEGEIFIDANKLEEPTPTYQPFKPTARIIGDAYRDKFYLGKNSTFRELNDDGEYAIIASFISVKARAGYLAGWGDQDYLQTLPKTEFSVNEIHKGEYIVIEAEGDSMDNGLKESISDGDKMLCRKLNRELWVNSKLHLNDYNPDFVIHHVTDGLTVKRIIEHNLDDRYIVCSSLNPDKNTYPDFKIKIEEISQIFTVVQTQQNSKRK